MEFVQGGRQTGKTHALAAWAKEASNRVILVASNREAFHYRHDQGVDSVFTFDQWSRLRQGRSQSEVAIDNLEWVVQHIVGHRHVSGPVTMHSTPMPVSEFRKR